MDIYFHELLKIILTDTGLTPPDLATRLDRERSSVYKWLSGKHQPKASYIPQIVSHTLGSATASQKVVLTKHLAEYVGYSALPDEIKKTLLSNTEDGSALLQEVLGFALNKASAQDIWLKINTPQDKSAWYERYMTVPVCAVAAAFLGGVLWNISNHLFGWTYYMGSPGNEPYGLSAFIWGILVLSPIVIISALFPKRQAAMKTVIFTGFAYTIVGGLSALLYYTSGIRAGIESLGLSYGAREIIIVAIYSFLISAPPYVALRIFESSPLDGKTIAWHIGLPVFAALFAVVLTLFIGRPEIEVAGIRGLLVGILMRSCMYYVMAKNHPEA